MSENKSFKQILQEKLRQQNHAESHDDINVTAPFSQNTQSAHIFDLNVILNLKPGAFTVTPKAFGKKYQNTENVFKKTIPAWETPNWSFHQQMAIDQLIRLGAKLHLRSNRKEIKNAYRRLLQHYHPDHNGHLKEPALKQCEQSLQAVIDAYRLFTSEERDLAA